MTAKDKEDGDLTSEINVVKNTVDTGKAGTYEVVYQVADSQNASVRKTIKIHVKAEEKPEDPNTPDKDGGTRFLRIASIIRKTSRPPSNAGSGSRFKIPRFVVSRTPKFIILSITTPNPAGAAS